MLKLMASDRNLPTGYIMEKQRQKPNARRWGKRKEYRCSVCGRKLPFCWNCPCGFQICDDCLKENLWGM